jgi:hypothetical protein
MAATLTNAEAYFAPTNHIKAPSWARYSDEQKAAALAGAKRTLNRACASTDIEVDRQATATTSPEYAIYEQALWILMTIPMYNAETTMAAAETAAGEAGGVAPGPISPEALDLLVGTEGVVLSRG